MPSNCGFRVAWTDTFRQRFAGTPLKRIALTHDGTTVRGEAMITAEGIEGGAVYAVSARLRDTILGRGSAMLHVDMRPDLDPDDLIHRLSTPRGKQSLSSFLRKAAALPPVAIALIHEAAINNASPLHANDPAELADRIKDLRLTLTGIGAIERAISTAGGISFDGVNEHFMLRARPGTFVAGEMLDWEAPTGGYLLQACLATGAAAGRGAVAWLRREPALDPELGA
jgi:uncharacterized flavoprotein (TIGR03862 family)